MRFCIGVLSLVFSGVSISGPDTCTYNTYKWNVNSRSAEDITQIQKPYSEITDVEVDKITGCTVCQEDQTTIVIGKIPPFNACKNIAADIRDAIDESMVLGQVVVKVVGYRVGMTKGTVDKNGHRTQFSNHSYGTAIDINPQFNGLYDNCIEFNLTCRLIKGGEWHSRQPESIQPDAHIVRILKSIGFHWGGEIAGKQKDFMHFSLTGY